MAVQEKTPRPRHPRRRSPPQSASRWLAESEALFNDFVVLTPYRFRPFTRSFESFDDYHRWRRAQSNPWYR